MVDKPPPPPLQGFNNNVKHRGRIFHIQTEDSGVKHPHVITHLFADGGRIIKSNKTNYAEHVGQADMAIVVRKLMKDQHKAMFISLRGGEFDAPIEEVCGAHPEALKRPATRGSVAAMSAANPSALGMAAVAPKEVVARPAATPASTKETVREAAVARKPEITVTEPASSRKISNPNLKRVANPATNSLLGGEIDFDSIERAAKEAASRESIPDVEQRAPLDSEPPGNRYAEAKPSSIFEEEPQSRSLFDEEGISEKSLDEVILSYLAEDLEPTPQDRE